MATLDTLVIGLKSKTIKPKCCDNISAKNISIPIRILLSKMESMVEETLVI